MGDCLMKRMCVLVLIPVLVFSILACGRSGQIATPQPFTNPQQTGAAGALPTLQSVETAVPAPVPAEYQGMYDQLDTALDAVKSAYSGQSGPAPVFAAELSYANGNIGEGLLSPGVMDLVRLQLDDLYKMGVRGVVVAIKFPLVEPDFPRSAEYLQFFKQVAAEIRQRNMKMLVESGALFSGTAFSPLKVDWSQYPNAQAFRDAEIHQLQTIASEIKPDYLQIANEPTTTAMLTHFVDSPDDYAAFIRNAVASIPSEPGMLLGAGAGTWENQAYVTNLYGITRLDFIDLHVYPLGTNGGMLSLAADLAKKAHSAGKRTVISETWLYKTNSSSSFQAGDFTSVIGQDVFSFWEPLDEKFIEDMTDVSRVGGIEFLSFFWVREFYAYLDYDQYHNIPVDQINPVITKVSVANSREHILSPLGVFYQNWISQSK
jgi:hypothetical protein